MTITLRHSGPPFESGMVLRSTHLDFTHGAWVNVGWPINDAHTLGTKVILGLGSVLSRCLGRTGRRQPESPDRQRDGHPFSDLASSWL